MLTTQIGSLPFQNIDQAIDYASQFDLPFVPTLPQLDPNELMMSLALKGMEANNPRPLEQCLVPMLASGAKKIKYQIMGPVSGKWFLEQSGNEVSLEQLKDFLHARIQCVLNLFDRYQSECILFLDEPALEFVNEDSYQILSQFIQDINDDHIGVHCCSNANWENFLNLPVQYLSMDYYRYYANINAQWSWDEVLLDKTILFGIVPTKEEHFSSESWVERLPKGNLSTHFLTPTCGLGISALDYVSKVHTLMDDVLRLKEN
jgi:hypothetical protein